MTFKQIGQLTPPCNHPEHNPPTMIVLPAGTIWEWSCPQCRKKTLVSEPYVICSTQLGTNGNSAIKQYQSIGSNVNV